jgi:hypothetical protein
MTAIDIDQFPAQAEHLAPEHRELRAAAEGLLGHLPVAVTVFGHPNATARTLGFDMELPYQVNYGFPVDVAQAAQKRIGGRAYRAADYSPRMFQEDAELNMTEVVAANPDEHYSRFLKRAGIKLLHRMWEARWSQEAAQFNAAAEQPVTVGGGFYVMQRSGRFQVTSQTGEAREIEVAQLSLDGQITVKGSEYRFSQGDIATSLTAFQPGVSEPYASYRTTSTKDRTGKVLIFRRDQTAEVTTGDIDALTVISHGMYRTLSAPKLTEALREVAAQQSQR